MSIFGSKPQRPPAREWPGPAITTRLEPYDGLQGEREHALSTANARMKHFWVDLVAVVDSGARLAWVYVNGVPVGYVQHGKDERTTTIVEAVESGINVATARLVVDDDRARVTASLTIGAHQYQPRR